MYLAKKYLEDTDILLLHGDLVVENDVFFSFCETEGSLMAGSKTKELPEKDFKAVVENDRIQRLEFPTLNRPLLLSLYIN